MIGSVRRRRVILGSLLAATVIAGALCTIAPSVAGWATGVFGMALVADLVLLRRHRTLEAERSMTAAFRSRRPSRDRSGGMTTSRR